MQSHEHSLFPPAATADEHGLVAITPVLNTEMLLDAYGHGIFPWSEGPVCWFSPDPRAVFLREYVKIPKNIGKIMRKEGLRVTLDEAFGAVIRKCADAHRSEGEWITPGFIASYTQLHKIGHAHSVEVWQGDNLVGGLYGVQLRGLFAGESMFHTVSNASKVAFAALIHWLDHVGNLVLDAQVLNPHTESLGAISIPRAEYLTMLRYAQTLRVRYEGEKWVTPPDDKLTRLLTHPAKKS